MLIFKLSIFGIRCFEICISGENLNGRLMDWVNFVSCIFVWFNIFLFCFILVICRCCMVYFFLFCRLVRVCMNSGYWMLCFIFKFIMCIKFFLVRVFSRVWFVVKCVKCMKGVIWLRVKYVEIIFWLLGFCICDGNSLLICFWLY